jgi:ATP-dependent DNA ligase
VIDSEAIVTNDKGWRCLCAFDMTELDREDLRRVRIEERKSRKNL